MQVACLEAHADGNVYIAVSDEPTVGIYVYDPDGNELARVSTGDELPINFGLGRDKDSNVLYVTLGKSL